MWCIPGRSDVSVIGKGYVPILMENVQEDVLAVNGNTPYIQSIEKIDSKYVITVSDCTDNAQLRVYDIYGNVISNNNINDSRVIIESAKSFRIVTLVDNGFVVESQILK